MKTTSEAVFNMNRREVLRILGLTAAAAFVPAGLRAAENAPALKITAEETATSFNNFYEFGFSKQDPAKNARDFTTKDWVVQVDGMVANPFRIPVSELLRRFGEEERIYRMRCVEGWSMVIPWQGFELNKLLSLARPDSAARYVAFESCADPKQMPQIERGSFPFPYREGLRLDEALHPLTILATGAYNKPLQPQNGAPIRLVVPWKYGFKSIKSVVKITLTEQRPPTTWDTHNPREYGFYSNVNPGVPHKRWSQSTERFVGPGGLKDVSRQPTLLFNGYDAVAGLYAGMDLAVDY